MDSKNRIIGQDCLAFLFLIASIIWFGHEMVWEGKVPFFRDLGTFFYPMRYSLAESLKAGELPLWDHRIAMGFPLLANFQSGGFYLPHFLFSLFPFFGALRFLFLFHYLVAATGSYALCRRWNYPPYLALIGAILFTLGGTVVSLTNLLNHFQTAVWLPWAIFFWERFLQSRSWKNFLAVVAVLLFQFLAGSPELYAMSLGLLLLDGLKFKLEDGGVTYPKIFILFLAANALVACLAMVQILPTMELFFESGVRRSQTFAQGVGWSLHPLSFLNFLFLDKEVVPGAANVLQPFFDREVPLFISLYLGAIALPGIFLWVWQSATRETAFTIGLIVVSSLLAMGGYTPLYSFLFREAPLFSLLRFPEKFLFITDALLLYVILRGLFYFFHSDSSSRTASLMALCSICFLYFLPYLFLRTHTAGLAEFIAARIRIPLSSPSLLVKTTSVVENVERQVFLVTGMILLLVLGKKGVIRPLVFKFLLVALVFVDLSLAHRPYQYLIDPEAALHAPKIIGEPDGSRLFYIPSQSHVHPDYFSSIKESLGARVGAFFGNLLPNTGILNNFEYAQEIDPLERLPYDTFVKVADRLPPKKLYRLLGALNVGHLISIQPLTGDGITLIRQFPEYPTWLYRVDRVTPRVSVVSEAVVESDPVKSIELLSSEEFDPLRKVILEATEPLRARKRFQGQAEIVKYTNRQVTLLARLNDTGILVLADSYYPGWKVYVDGKESQILRADFFFRGVLLPAGKHVVEYRYGPNSFRIGLIISFATLLGTAFYSIFSLHFRERKGTLTKL